MKAWLVLGSLLVAAPGFAHEEEPDRPLVTVAGEAEVRVAPDQAVLRMRVVTEDKDLGLAKQRNDDQIKATLALLHGLSITAEKVQTGLMTIDRRESEREGGKPLFLGYEVTKGLNVVIDDLGKTDEVLAQVVKAGVNRVDGVELRVSDTRPHKDKARSLAIRAAREKASALAGEIGQTIGKAFTIREEPEVDWAAANRSNVLMASNYAEGDNGGDSFSAGQNVIRARVMVAFELR